MKTDQSTIRIVYGVWWGIDMKPLNTTMSTSHYMVGSMAHPIGSSYTQYPNMKSPHELFGGAWVKRFSNEGVFFRTEGGRAKAFNGGVQTDELKAHSHKQNALTRHRNYAGMGVTDKGYKSHRVNTDVTGGPETRPKNRTYRIWERVG